MKQPRAPQNFHGYIIYIYPQIFKYNYKSCQGWPAVTRFLVAVMQTENTVNTRLSNLVTGKANEGASF